MDNHVNIEIAYAIPEKQVVIPVYIQNNAKIIEAIIASGVMEQFEELRKIHAENFFSLQVGIFSTPCSLDRKVQEGDRIEIYRPLQNDPKEARRQRANHS